MPGPGATEYVIIDGFLIDCSLNERHSFESDVTEFPVESGSNIVDNIRPLPVVVEMECLVTNTPIGLIATKRTGFQDPVDDAYDLLMKIRDRREPVLIQTSLRTYENMALKSLSIPRGPGGKSSLTFTAVFQQISTVENKRTIRVSTPIATGKKRVSKAAKPDSTQTFLIDRFLNAWWDSEFETWRATAVFRPATRNDETGVTTYSDYKSKWHLYRQAALTSVKRDSPLIGVSDLETQRDVSLPNYGPEEDGFRRVFAKEPEPFRQLIVVAQDQCVLHGFVVKAKPGEKRFTLRNRTY